MKNVGEIRKTDLILHWLKPDEELLTSYGLVNGEQFVHNVKQGLQEKKEVYSEVVRAMTGVYGVRRAGEGERIKIGEEEVVSLRLVG